MRTADRSSAAGTMPRNQRQANRDQVLHRLPSTLTAACPRVVLGLVLPG
jgi:hypothetical protein